MTRSLLNGLAILQFQVVLISPVDKTQVSRLRLFKNLKENKTSLDIPNKFMKIVSEAIIIPFTLLWYSGRRVYQDNDTGNYKPIAPLLSITKVLE